MEIFWETLCEFIESRAKNVSEEGELMLICGEKDYNNYYECLNAAQHKFRKKEQKSWRKIYDGISDKGLMVFVFLIVIAIVSIIALFTGFGWVSLAGSLFVMVFCYFYSTDRKTPKTNWIYTFKVKLWLWLWKIPPYDHDVANPRCIFIRWNEHEASTWNELVANKIMQKLQNDLGIKNLYELNEIVKNAEYSSSNFQEYSLWKDSVVGPMGNVPLWCFWLLSFFCFLLFVAGGIYYESYIAKFASLVGPISKYVYEKFKSTGGVIEPDVEANQLLLDVLCRVHRMITRESIFFALVTNHSETDILTKIPTEYRKHFKFLINVLDDIRFTLGMYDNYDHVYYVIPALEIETNGDDLFKIAVQCVRDQKLKRFPTKRPIFCRDALDFLSLFIKNNDNNNKALSDENILFSVFLEIAMALREDGNIEFGYNLYHTEFRAVHRDDEFFKRAYKKYNRAIFTCSRISGVTIGILDRVSKDKK